MKLLYKLVLYIFFLTFLIVSQVECQHRLDYRTTPEKIFAGCLTTKYCYSPEDRDVADQDPNCIESADCRHLIAIGGGQEGDYNEEDEVVFEIYAESKAWLGIGFSHDDKMGDEYVIACIRPNISSVHDLGTIVSQEDILPTVTNSWNSPFGKDNKVIKDLSNIQVVETYVSTLAIYCKFYLKKKFVKIDPYERKEHEFDLSQKYCMLVAWSDFFYYKNPKDVDPLGDHFISNRNESTAFKGGQQACKEFKSFDTIYQPNAKQKVYFKLHGGCLIITWIFLVPVGNFIGCFFKEIYKKRETCKMKTWLLLHCIFHILALALLIVGILIHFPGKSGWNNNGRDLVHLIGGYSVVGLYAIALISGIFLKVKKHKLTESEKRDWPTFIHDVSSHSAHFLANLVIAWSPELQFSGLSCDLAYVVIGWMIVYTFICVIMAFHKFWGPILADEPEDPGGDPLSRIDALLTDGKVDDEDHPKTMQLKTIMLIAFTFVAFFMAMSLVLMLFWPPVGPCFNKESDDFFEKQVVARYQAQSIFEQPHGIGGGYPQEIRTIEPFIPPKFDTDDDYDIPTVPLSPPVK